MPILAFLVLWAPNCYCQGSIESTEVDTASIVAFIDVAVVTMQDDNVLEGQTVIIQGDRIVSMGPAETQAIPQGTMEINGTGLYLIPGLADMHVHVRAPFADGSLFLNAGITTVFSLGSRANASNVALAWQKVLTARERSRTKAFMGPTFYTVGPLILGGETPDEVEKIVRENAENRFDMVKIHGDVSPEAFTRLHETASSLGIKVTGHAQRNRGMQPVYEYKQDLAHVEEYLYTAFNPNTRIFQLADKGSLFVLSLLLFINAIWGLGALWRRVRKHQLPNKSDWSRPIKKAVGKYTAIGWLFFFGLGLSMTHPYPGLFAGQIAAIILVTILMLIVVYACILLTLKTLNTLRKNAVSIWIRSILLLVVGLAWTFVFFSAYLTFKNWKTTDAGLTRIAQETAAAGIWVTPTLVAWDYIVRQSGEEFQTLIQRPDMRYLRPSTRDNWIKNNTYRQFPKFLSATQVLVRGSYGKLMNRLVAKLHEAKVPLLAGSDVGVHGVLPGSSLHEELRLLVEVGLTPFEALQTATVNPAIYLNCENEFGKISVGCRADLVLLRDNPLDDINHTQSRIGVMRRGRWFSAKELETALAQLAEERK
jgi:imidazolonepropionase-like amidohydrolase